MINFQNFYNFAACLKLTELSRLVAYSSFVLNFIAGENTVGFSLRGVRGVRLTQKMLDSHEDLFDGDSRSPVLFFVEDREAHGARRINIRVKKWRIELALWRAAWVVFLERHRQPVVSAFPRRFFLTWNNTFPVEQVECSVALFHRFCYKPKRVIFSPSLPLFGESGNRDSGHILDFCFEVRQWG